MSAARTFALMVGSSSSLFLRQDSIFAAILLSTARFPSLKATVLLFSAPIFHQKFSILLRADDFSLIHHVQPLNCGRLP